MKRPKKLPRGVFVRNAEYWIRYTDQHRKLRREKVGPFLELVKSTVEKRRSEVREGKFFPEKITQRPILFSEVARDFLSYSKKFKRSHAHDTSRMAELLRLWRDVPIPDLTPGRIEKDLSECSEQDQWMPATYNRYRALVSEVFSLAIRDQKATTNPIRGTRHRVENNTRVRYLSDDEEKQLIDHVRTNCPEHEAEIVVALHSGMRRSEQYVTPDCPDGGLKWQHINFRNDLITLPRSKHGESRHVPMNSTLRETLEQLRKSTGSLYVFPVEPPDVWFPAACEKAKVEDLTWHCLRHTFASRLVMAGVDLRTVQELMGHKTITTTLRYAHLAPKHQAEAVERLVASTSTATSTNQDEEKEIEAVAIA
jgi:integrase